ncbi:MAG: transketolase family protein [Candidatus Geothermincolia bacterium]
MIETRHTRKGFGDAVTALGEADPRIVVLDADLSKSTQTEIFAKRFPDRFFDCGVAEQNMMGVAAGLASCGKIVFVSTFAIFASGRAYEQVRNTIAYPNLNVKICPSHGGVAVGEDGSSHQALEDIALMRAVPNMRVIVPADYYQAREAVKEAAGIAGPVYIRMGRPAVPVIYDDDYRFELGRANVLREGTDLSILANGVNLAEALQAAETLAGSGISAEVLDMACVKPLDREAVLATASKTGHVLTVEDHSVTGGLGGAVAELLAEEQCAKLRRLGIPDRFGSSGTGPELLAHFGIDAAGIVSAAQEMYGS